MRIEEAVTKAWSSVLTQQMLAAVMDDLQRLGDDSLLSGEDSGLENVWEEICVQVQAEESAYGDAYRQTAESFIELHLNGLEHEARLALWSVTDSGWSWIYDHHEDEDGHLSAPVDESEIVQVLWDRLLIKAEYFTNPNVSRYVGDEDGDYEDEDEDEDDDEDDQEEEEEGWDELDEPEPPPLKP